MGTFVRLRSRGYISTYRRAQMSHRAIGASRDFLRYASVTCGDGGTLPYGRDAIYIKESRCHVVDHDVHLPIVSHLVGDLAEGIPTAANWISGARNACHHLNFLAG